MSGSSTRAERRALQEEQRQQKALSALSDQACEVVLVRHGETQWNVEQRLQGQLLPGPGLTERGQLQAAVLAARLRCERFDAIYSSDLLRATQTADAVIAARDTHTAAEADGGNSDCSNCCSSNEGGSSGGSGGASEPPAGAAAGEAADGARRAQHPALPLRVDPRLRERNLGVLQGLTRAEAARQHPQAYDALSAHAGAAAVEGAPETLDELEARAEGVLCDLAACHPGQRILVVTHGGFLQAAYKRAAGHVNWGKNMNASINILRIEAAGGSQQQQQPQQAGRGRQSSLWAVVRWGDADHLQDVGALASAFGGGTEG